MPRTISDDHLKALEKGKQEYWAKRRAMKNKSLKTSPKVKAKAEVISEKPYTFATVTMTTTTGDVYVGHGFSKWDNNPTPNWDPELGEQIAIGRAKKDLETKHGISVD